MGLKVRGNEACRVVCPRESSVKPAGSPRSNGHNIAGTDFMASVLVHCLVEGSPRFAELNHTGLEIAQRTIDQAVVFLVVCEKVMPEGMLRISISTGRVQQL